MFYALSLLTWEVDHDPLANPKKAITILNHVFEENPKDPGAAHFSIHASDAPQLAERGLSAARHGRADDTVADFVHIPRVDVTESLRSNSFDSRIASFPAMYALEMHRWKEAAELQPLAEVEPYHQAITYWARAVAAGYSSDVGVAQDAVDQYDAMVEATKKGKHAFRAKYMNTEQDEACAWLAFAEGKTDDAIVLLGGIADKQDVRDTPTAWHHCLTDVPDWYDVSFWCNQWCVSVISVAKVRTLKLLLFTKHCAFFGTAHARRIWVSSPK